ncbi:phage head-tail joining protein [Roseovarius sp. SYSU LYC5161]|uniref:phage head-tail joining protein n=1 Tax=Roseovarius halophilus (ex Wu et al. 2025) TaxID=3376060 RepID=UPI00399B1E6F
MPTITDLRARRDALSAQRSSGVARVSYDGKTVDYRSVAEIDRAIEALDESGQCRDHTPNAARRL